MEICIENMVVDEGDEMILPMSVEYRNDITEDDLIVLCRLCGNCSNQLMPIFTGDGAEHRLPEKIEEHLPIIKVSRDDLLPLNICYQCASTLISWHELYHACKEADQRLRDICLKLQLRAEKSDDTFVEVQDHFAENDALDSSEENNDFDKRSKNLEVNHSPSDSHSVMDPATSCAVTEKTTDIGSEDVDVTKTSVENDRYVGFKSNCSYRNHFDGRRKIFIRNLGEKLIIRPSNLVSATPCNDHVGLPEIEIDTPMPKACDGAINSAARSYNSGRRRKRWETWGATMENESARQLSLSRFECDLCGRRFTNQVTFTIHENERKIIGGNVPMFGGVRQLQLVTANVNPGGRYECAHCNRAFKLKKTLRMHIVGYHCAGTRQLKCDYCDRTFDAVCDLAIHRSVHCLDRNVICRVCGGRPPSKLGSYESVVASKMNLKLCTCSQTVEMKSDELRPKTKKARAHGWFARSTAIYARKSPTASGRQQSSSDFEADANVTKKAPETMCNECGRDCGSCYGLKMHRRMHVPKVDCGLCGKRYSKYYLPTHMQIHAQIKSFACDTCGKRFAQKSSLRSHKLLENNVRKFMCNECGMQFVLSSRLQAHLKTHLTTMPFKCEDCDCEFGYLWQLRQHRVKHSTVREYMCQTCARSYKTMKHLRQHWQYYVSHRITP